MIAEYIAVRPGFCGGKPYIAGHRIKVQQIAVWHERLGMTPDEIFVTYPSLSLPAVDAALAYYHSHRGEIDSDVEADERFVTESKLKSGSSIFEEKKRALLHGQDYPVSPG